jgi:AcrR family transcriptional regulator
MLADMIETRTEAVARGRAREGADTRERIILTAERLIADEGVGVSLRRIGLAAGQRNASAIQYHFGTKEDLVHAIFRYRLPYVNARRVALLDALERDTLADLVRIDMTPYVELIQDPKARYVDFVARMFLDAQFALMLERVNEPWLIEGQLEIHRRMRRLLRHLPRPVRHLRIRFALTHFIYGLAERRHTVERMGPEWASSLDGFVDSYVQYAVAGLTAPA